MKKKYSNIIVNEEDKLLTVLKKMDRYDRKLMVVMKDDLFISLVSIGDIQRAIIKNIDLNEPISRILRKEVTIATTDEDLDAVKVRMKERRNELMPIVSSSGELVDIIFWDDLFKKEPISKTRKKINLPVIIMAGGKGTRLKPLTNVLPKPLIPINEKTIVEDIMDRFVECGCKDFYLSVNYKSEIIRYYFDSLKNTAYNISYFQETKPLGTAGSLHLLRDKIHSTFFVSNCDIIVKQDYRDILNYHIENKNEITIVAALKNYPIPYGTLNTENDGLLSRIEEKPEVVFKINTGFYLLEPHLINEIPEQQFYHITYFIEKLQKEKRRVGVFPVSENAWIDIGNWQEYLAQIKVNNV